MHPDIIFGSAYLGHSDGKGSFSQYNQGFPFIYF